MATHRGEARLADLILQNPVLRPGTVLDVPEKLAHRLLDVLVDDLWSGGVIAIFGSITEGIAHVAQAALINQVGNELQLVAAFKVRELRWVSRLDQRFESGLDEGGDTAAEN